LTQYFLKGVKFKEKDNLMRILIPSQLSYLKRNFFRVNYFLYLVDQAIISLKKRFEQYQQYESIFGFLFSSQNLQLLDDATLNSCCSHLEQTLKHNEQSNIDGKELCVELRLLRNMFSGGKIPVFDILNFLKSIGGYFPNT
jgi:hypothetical protein